MSGTSQLELIAFVCEKVWRGEYAPAQLQRMTRLSMEELLVLTRQRQSLHESWLRVSDQPEMRLQAREAMNHSQRELAALEKALGQLQRSGSLSRETVRQARHRFEVAERARRQYMQKRVMLEPHMLERLSSR